jgi:hypothetical protein
MQSRVTFNDLFPQFGISVDAKGTIQDVLKYAHLYGGTLTVYDMSKTQFAEDFKEKPYRLSYRLIKAPFELFIYGIELSEDDYHTQILVWNGSAVVDVQPNSPITLIDNSYLLVNV